MKTVTIAYEYTDAEGRVHKPDAVVELPIHEAQLAIRDGVAREGVAEVPVIHEAQMAIRDGVAEVPVKKKEA